MKHGLPVAAIIGRPNVGKSSLFNLLLGERKSIVDEMEGVTRDINIGRMQSGKVDFYLYDTAGYLEKGDAFNSLVQEKVRQAVLDTDLIIFTVDGREMHPIDKDLALFLRRQGKPVIVVANKLDNRNKESLAVDFYQFGFDEVIPFSVLHKRGYSTLMERIEDHFSPHIGAEEKQEQNDEIRIALVGKPNVGKSMLLNTILGYDRSIVSEVAGTTRDSLDDIFRFEGKTIRLVDTAGLRKKGKIEEDIEYFSNVRTIQAIERSHVVIQLLDAGEGMSQQDKRITEMVMEKGRGLVIAFNKWDLKHQPNDENYRLIEDHRKEAYRQIPTFSFVPIEFVSAKDNYKVKKLLETALRVYHDYQYRVPTSELNAWLTREVKESDSRKHVSNVRVYYVTQVYTAPPRFVFFINDKEHVRKDYARQLENKLRTAFEFTGVPIKVTFKPKNENERE